MQLFPINLSNVDLNLSSKGLTATITQRNLAYSLFWAAAKELDVDDTAGCDWYTDKAGNIYLGSREWQVGFQNESVAALVDAANTLLYGYRFDIAHTEGEGRWAA